MSNSATTRVLRAQAKFLIYLEELTRLKKAKWIRSYIQPGLVLCRVGGELIIFEASNGEPEPVDPDGDVGGIVCKFRNWTWLWLTPLEDGERLLRLLRNAKIDEQQFGKWQAESYRSGPEFLKDTLEKAKG